jgi:hypothetical protein
MPDITIVKKPNDPNDPRKGDKLEPDTGRRTKVKAGDNVTFRRASPFGAGKETVAYDTPLPITVAFDANPQRNVYKYSCRGGGLSSEDGGEVEIIQN